MLRNATNLIESNPWHPVSLWMSNRSRVLSDSMPDVSSRWRAHDFIHDLNSIACILYRSIACILYRSELTQASHCGYFKNESGETTCHWALKLLGWDYSQIGWIDSKSLMTLRTLCPRASWNAVLPRRFGMFGSASFNSRNSTNSSPP